MESGAQLESLIIPRAGSDHWPLILSMNMQDTPQFKPFRFEKFWLLHPDFQHLAKEWWSKAAINHGSSMYRFQQRLKNFKVLLKQWNKNCFGNIFQSIQSIEKQLEEIQKIFISGTRTADLMKEEEKLREQLEERKNRKRFYGSKNPECNG
jgi:hypothetical protein